MKRFLLTATTILALLLGLGVGTARAGTSVHANGKTYTPAANVATYKTADGSVPRVTLPQAVPYYATQPPKGTYARVYAANLKLVVWVSLTAAAANHWYVGHSGGFPYWAIPTFVFLAVGLGAAVVLFRKRGAA